VTRKAIAAHLHLTERSITELVDKHDFPSRIRGRERRFPLARCFTWYLKFKQEEAVSRIRPPAPTNVTDSRARKLTAEAEKAELELAERRSELLPLDVHEERVSKLCDRIAATCKGGLARFVGDVQRAQSSVDASTLLERIGDTILRDLVSMGGELEAEVEHDVSEEADGDRAAAVA
jgi:phage terminase Nu1 subunit (DNA packaging protein)